VDDALAVAEQIDVRKLGQSRHALSPNSGPLCAITCQSVRVDSFLGVRLVQMTVEPDLGEVVAKPVWLLMGSRVVTGDQGGGGLVREHKRA